MTDQVQDSPTATAPPPGDTSIASVAESTIRLERDHLAERTFLLGNEGGFVLYLPVEQNQRDRTLFPIKWFGASEFGRKFLEAILLHTVRDGVRTLLNEDCQTGFEQRLDTAQRTFVVDGCTIRQNFFVPNRCRAVVMTVDADQPVELEIEPEFDMRYYQAFNTEFDRYTGSTLPCDGGTCLRVTNAITIPAAHDGDLEFYAVVGPARGSIEIKLIPEEDRLREKTYLKDEARQKLICESYAETHESESTSPDEAPIWNTYSTSVYAPARIKAHAPLTLVFAFGDAPGDPEKVMADVQQRLPTLIEEKREDSMERLRQGALVTGMTDVDRAYEQIFTRFNTCLVARNVSIHTGSYDIKHWSAIFAGNKYFLDAWKRDENISLIGLLTTSDYAAVCDILSQTWRFQDKRTGRLPHIIRLGEPLVYFSSDGTLWALRRLYQYTRATGNTHLLDEKYHMVEHFFAASLDFVKRGLLPSGGIIDKAYLWETWEDTPYTPRDGYPVEIELLWLTAVANFLPTIRDRNPALGARLEATLQEGRETFKLFHLDGYLADSLSYDFQPRPLLTPNGYVAFSLDYPLPDDLRYRMILLARQQLAGQVGIRSLAPRDWKTVLSPEFVADTRNFDKDNMASVGIYNYHRGIEWLWLNQFFVQAELSCGSTQLAYWTYLHGQVHETLHEAGLGGLSELYDMRGPLGADFQAWSMASFIASLHKFAGISVDAIDRYIHIRPSIPTDWPYLKSRQQVGDTRYDLHYAVQGDSQIVEVDAVDSVPPGYSLQVGVRVPAGRPLTTVEVNGREVPESLWTRKPGCAQEVDDEVWIESPFSDRVRAVFNLAP